MVKSMTKKTKQIINELQNKLEYCATEIENMSRKLDIVHGFISSMQDKIAVKVSSCYLLNGPMYSIHAYYAHCVEVYEVSKYIPYSMFIALDMADNLKAEVISSNDKYIVFLVVGKNKENFMFIIDKYCKTLVECPTNVLEDALDKN